MLTPARWLTDHRSLLPASGNALDVACGRGRNALWLAAEGFIVRAVDRDAAAIEALNAEAVRAHLQVTGEVVDLESGNPRLGVSAFDLVVVTHYLHRPLFPSLLAALRTGGTLVYETFTREQARRGKPTNPAFLLERDELRRLVAPLVILAAREGEAEGRDVASVVARKAGEGG